MPSLLSSTLRPHTEARFEEDWARQRHTAEDILRRLRAQEGVILADQVGMGKTYVALAVAVSQILATPESGQVVIFVPPAVADKWVREWKKFSETLLEPGTGIRCVEQPLRSGEDFLKALDDPPDRRKHIVVVTHSALTNDIKDTFVQLALLYYATRYQRDGEGLRRRIAKWSTGSSGLVRDRRFTEARVAKLLASRPQDWREVWRRMPGCDDLGGEPVPQQIIDAIDPANFGALREVIRSLPVYRTANIKARIAAARRELKDALTEAWKHSLASIQQDLPLLIVDEAHRLKNSYTHVSKLFAERSTADKEGGVFAGQFRRMLFLTATPFELGHTELVNVLSRMGAVRPLDPPRQTLPNRLEALSKVLAAAQANAITFDTAWARLTADDLPVFDNWAPTAPAPPGLGAAAREAWEHARLARQARHELHAALRPWVIRHERPHRRTYYPGNAILAADKQPAGGLDIPEAAALPFLLAARAQSVALDDSGPARPLFAYGIASSYEAFGRLGPGHTDDGRDIDVPEEDPDVTAVPRVRHGASSDAVRWYRDEIDRALADADVRAAHPKVRATVDKAAQLWFAGEKCLSFCWFIKTGEAVEQTLASRIDRLILDRASVSLRTGRDEDTRAELERIAERLFRRDTSSYELIRDKLSRALRTNAGGHDDVLDLVVDAAIRHLRTPSYLVRYTPLTPQIDADDVWAGIHGDNPGRLVLLKKWRRFAERLAKARDQIEAVDSTDEHDSEFARINAALLGARNEDDQTVRRGASLHPVRRASGQTDRHVRERLIALFNTPFSPDLLVASSVMGEGIDLHQECRFVIHHDLDWNPGVLEQRTGRLDRIGALAERENKPIEVYEPYLAGTHDEKMFRVVKDRAGWFDIVMGRASGADEHVTDAEEARIPLHDIIRAALTMDLRSPGAA
ncbi:MAG: hypothetical protein DLM57_03455 [Pseudonocardiales bacterium]|nr:MAG: hypothetical protein DLM57_03455 [Pseudonocardiales bacterium]